jgi:hypothetical protein
LDQEKASERREEETPWFMTREVSIWEVGCFKGKGEAGERRETSRIHTGDEADVVAGGCELSGDGEALGFCAGMPEGEVYNWDCNGRFFFLGKGTHCGG